MKTIEISYNKWNYLKDDGTYLLDKQVKFCYDFSEGFGQVKYKDDSWNLVTLEGNRLLKNNVDNCFNFFNEFANIRINNVWYYIDKECNFYSNDKVSFKELYYLYPHMRSLLVEIISKYTYHDTEEYFIYTEQKVTVITKIKNIIKKLGII